MIADVIKPLYPYIGRPISCLLAKNSSLSFHKGLAGQLIEQILGACSSNQRLPDLPHLGIEIKTLPVSTQGIPLENTFINKITLPFDEPKFEKSMLWLKIQKILWVPLIGSRHTMMLDKIIGHPVIWQPDGDTFDQIKKDWYELTTYIRLGEFDQLNSQIGEFLHIRPKAANATQKIQLNINGFNHYVLPIGFYFRKILTRKIIESNYAF
ncbi:DNA mismatch repair protein MutH [bacterium]|jgi:DNA mismatch repair protein MutH|nr:DNA mismatch repair protein MutH [bacterium]